MNVARLGTVWSVIDEERDAVRLAIGLQHVAFSLRRLFGRDGADWGRELADPAKRNAVMDELRLAEKLVGALKAIPPMIASYALTPEDLVDARRVMSIDVDADLREIARAIDDFRRELARRKAPREGDIRAGSVEDGTARRRSRSAQPAARRRPRRRYPA
jgi:hypothetical protein